MRLFELFSESGYTPPIKPEEYQDHDKLWDYLRTDAVEEIDEWVVPLKIC